MTRREQVMAVLSTTYAQTSMEILEKLQALDPYWSKVSYPSSNLSAYLSELVAKRKVFRHKHGKNFIYQLR